MKQYNKPLLALLIGAMTIVGAAGVAEARMGMGGHGGFHHGGAYAELTPEMQQMMEKAYNDIAPLQLELRAKQQELTAKIYGGADDKAVQQLSAEISALQKRVTDARVKMQQDFAKAGVPMQYGCPMGGGRGFHGGGPMGGKGFHGPMGFHGGMGGYGGCPGMGMMGPGPAMPGADGASN